MWLVYFYNLFRRCICLQKSSSNIKNKCLPGESVLCRGRAGLRGRCSLRAHARSVSIERANPSVRSGSSRTYKYIGAAVRVGENDFGNFSKSHGRRGQKYILTSPAHEHAIIEVCTALLGTASMASRQLLTSDYSLLGQCRIRNTWKAHVPDRCFSQVRTSALQYFHDELCISLIWPCIAQKILQIGRIHFSAR